VFSSIQVDDISQFLPPGFKADAAATESSSSTTTTEKTTTAAAASSSTDKATGGFKLDLSSLFSDVNTDDVSAFLPPGYDPEKAAKEDETQNEEKEVETKVGGIKLKFPTRPTAAPKKTDKPKSRSRPSGPPPFVPKIKSFADR